LNTYYVLNLYGDVHQALIVAKYATR